MPYKIVTINPRCYRIVPVAPSKRTHTDSKRRVAEGRVIAFEILDKVWGYDNHLESGKTGS